MLCTYNSDDNLSSRNIVFGGPAVILRKWTRISYKIVTKSRLCQKSELFGSESAINVSYKAQRRILLYNLESLSRLTDRPPILLC